MNGINSISVGGLPGMAFQDLMALFLQFMVVSLRLGAFLLSAPFFGARSVPLTVRIVFSAVIVFAVLPKVSAPDTDILVSAKAIPILIQELTIGLAAGLILSIFFASVALAGEKIASSAGLSFAMQVDPNSGGSTPVVSQALSLFMTAIFLSLNGHLAALGMMMQSYDALPIGATGNLKAMLESGVLSAGIMFASAASIMFPVVAVLFLVNATIGIITRSAPTLNLFSFGFPITLISVFFLLFLSVPHIGVALSDLTEKALEMMQLMLAGVANGGR